MTTRHSRTEYHRLMSCAHACLSHGDPLNARIYLRSALNVATSADMRLAARLARKGLLAARKIPIQPVPCSSSRTG